jgi:hypothetical protein
VRLARLVARVFTIGTEVSGYEVSGTKGQGSGRGGSPVRSFGSRRTEITEGV